MSAQYSTFWQGIEELVSIHLTNQERLHGILSQQAHVMLALDGLRPDVGHEVLWVLCDSISGEILLARPLLSECEALTIAQGKLHLDE